MPGAHGLDKTFIDRSPAALIPANHTGDGGGSVQLPDVRPIPGQTCIGHSLITDIIGEGGMATVYKVWNERLEAVRVIKLLLHDSFYARFETETKILAKLHHEGIVAIYYADEWNGLPYMEMEFVDGPNLQQILAERGKLPETVCVAVALMVANALAHAHTLKFTLAGKQYSGIVHRDIKPANIMITKLGAAKLIDFGVACPARANLHSSAEGNIDGTLHYLSPEQMKGSEADNRSDIYAFGAILYEMIAGAKTFPQESVAELLKRKFANKYKSFNDYGITVNADLTNIIHKCLKSSPAKRYQNTQDLADDLQKLHGSLTTQSPEDVLQSYFNGTGDFTPKDSIKTTWITRLGIQEKLKRLWPLGKPMSPGTTVSDKPKTTGISDNAKTPETAENPKNEASATK